MVHRKCILYYFCDCSRGSPASVNKNELCSFHFFDVLPEVSSQYIHSGRQRTWWPWARACHWFPMIGFVYFQGCKRPAALVWIPERSHNVSNSNAGSLSNEAYCEYWQDQVLCIIGNSDRVPGSSSEIGLPEAQARGPDRPPSQEYHCCPNFAPSPMPSHEIYHREWTNNEACRQTDCPASWVHICSNQTFVGESWVWCLLHELL